ncbi:parvalbumin, thymic-like [Echinops telfairi]|uniref:Parvalbumin n=1 Tax=Echinops telfairi TaxID=9371 RepID=A0ABM0IVY9_ECHTE|nr:parvalbumin, thymic-like [Echinops telfairi]
MTDIILSKDVGTALSRCKDPGRFNYNTFFSEVGRSNPDKDHIKQVFAILEQDRRGFIEEDVLKQFLENSPSAQVLPDKEENDLLQAGNSNGDGQIGVDGFQSLGKP